MSMSFWINALIITHVLVALAIIGLVLLQHGKGADMGSGFGGGASGSLFGATGSANFLSRSTAACAVVFFVCTLILAYLGNANSGAPRESTSVLERAGAAASAPASAIPQIPTAPVALPSASAPAPAASAGEIPK